MEPLFFMSNLLIRRVIRQNLVLLLLMNIIIDVTYSVSGNYTNFSIFQCKTSDVVYYVISYDDC